MSGIVSSAFAIFRSAFARALLDCAVRMSDEEPLGRNKGAN